MIVAALVAGVAVAAKVDVVFPPAGSMVDLSPECHVLGSVSPVSAKLLCNGKPVPLTDDGAFLFMAKIKPGTNVLKFECDGKKSSHRFTVRAAAPQKTRPGICVVSPKMSVGVEIDEPISLECTAPTGRVVTATVGEREIPLSETSAGRYVGKIRFKNEVESVPVVFGSEGLADATAGKITVRKLWPLQTVTGRLFETRARELPGDNGATLGYPRPGMTFRSNGFDGWYTRAKFGTNQVYIAKKFLKPGGTGPETNPSVFPHPDPRYPARPAVGSRPEELLIAVDAGHGGDDSGAVGPHRRKEKDANLQQAKMIAEELKKLGFNVLMTRPNDAFVGLYDRVQKAYDQRATAFISVHHNATGSGGNPDKARNVITYSSEPRGRALAACIQPKLAAIAGIPDGGLGEKSLAVCRNPIVPSCLIEFDFITSPAGEKAIFSEERQRAFAQAVASGVLDWVRGKGD